MIRQFVFAAALVCLSTCDHAYTLDDIPAQYKELMPKEAKNFLTSLSKSDKAAIMEIAKNCAKYNTEEEALAALKEKAPELGERVEKIHDTLKKRIEALGPEAKHYVKEIVAVARKIHASIAEGKKLTAVDLKEYAQKEIERYNGLPESAKKELQRAFPLVNSVLRSPKMQKMLNSLKTKH